MIALLAVLAAAASGLGWGKTWEEVRSGAGGIRSIQADFRQEKHMKILVRPLVSHGKFWFRMPDALRWEYTAPVESVLLLYNGRSRRSIRTAAGWAEENTAGLQAMQVVVGEITHWLEGDFTANPDFAAELSPDRKITLTPRSEGLGRIIEKIVLDLSETPGIIAAVTIYEGPDSFTRLTFRNPVVNQPIGDAVFQKVE